MLALPAAAQIAQKDVLDAGPQDEAVEQAIWVSRVRDEVIYLDPAADFKPDADLRVDVPPPEATRDEREIEARWTNGLLFGALLLGLLVVIILFGGRMQVSFRGRKTE